MHILQKMFANGKAYRPFFLPVKEVIEENEIAFMVFENGGRLPFREFARANNIHINMREEDEE